MKTPFTIEEFFQVFENYNTMIFPIQLVLLAIGIIAVLFIHSKSEYRHQMITVVLGFLWIWTGFVYHILSFSIINKAAYIFGAIFILQGVFFFIELTRKKLEFTFDRSTKDYIGYFFIIFGLIIYPAISYFSAGELSGTISLGLPCPTTIMTFGFLMLTSRVFPKYHLIIPTLWAIIGTGAAVNFGVYQDYLMLLAAIVANVYLLRRKRIGG